MPPTHLEAYFITQEKEESTQVRLFPMKVFAQNQACFESVNFDTCGKFAELRSYMDTRTSISIRMSK